MILIDSTLIAPGDTAIVYLSSQVPPGRTVTVRDSTGALAPPQAIRLSTVAPILFSDGTSSIQTSVAFGSLTAASRDATTWDLINTFGFPLYESIVNVSSLTTSTLIGTNLTINGPLITNSLLASTILSQSTIQADKALYASTLIVGPPSTIATPPYLANPGYAAYVLGNAYLSSSTTIQGPLTVASTATFQSALTVGGSFSTSLGLSVGGPMTVQGTLTAAGGSGTTTVQALSSLSTATILGTATFNSNVAILSNATAGGTITAAAVTTSTIQINPGGFLQLGTGPTLRTRTDIVPGQTFAAFNAPVYTPYLSAQTVLASTSFTASSLNVTSLISAPSLAQFVMSSAAITNPNGSLAIGSITANTLTLSNAFNLTDLTTSNLAVSNLAVTGAFVASAGSLFSTSGTLTTSSLQTAFLSTGNLFATQINTPSIGLSTLYVASTISGGPSFSSLFMPGATVDNSAGTLFTGQLVATTLSTSTLVVGSGVLRAASTLQFQVSSVQMSNAAISSVFLSSLQTSTVTVSRIVIGQTPTSSNGPDFFYQASPTPSTNVVVTGGPGDYLNPYTVSNVKPPAQPPATPYTTYIAFEADYKSQPPPPGMRIGYTATLLWAGQAASYLEIANGAATTLYGTAGVNQTVTGTIQRSTFEIAASLYGNSAIQVTFNFQYSPNATVINSNCVVEFNNGILNWDYSLNGTTIQNTFNDIATRNLFYYGSLSFASDPRLKTDIQPADLRRCYDIVRDLPLRRYRYNDTYCSTFGIQDTHRLGFLATELAPFFPKSVQPVEGLLPSEETTPYLTIDTSQVDMAHLGATQYLIGLVQKLEAEVEALAAGQTPQGNTPSE